MLLCLGQKLESPKLPTVSSWPALTYTSASFLWLASGIRRLEWSELLLPVFLPEGHQYGFIGLDAGDFLVSLFLQSRR